MLTAGKARNEDSPAEIPLADRRHRFAVAPARWSLLSQKNRRLRRADHFAVAPVRCLLPVDHHRHNLTPNP
jgi:hypothetical protein